MRLLVDGLFFQLANSGIARVWRSVLDLLAADGRFEIFFLDRGRAPDIPGATYIPFPAHGMAPTAAGSFLMQKICDHYSIDVFTSTYYSTPLSTPMVLMIHDMIPELFGFDLTARDWMEKDNAISYAQRYICVSENTRKDLMALYPEIPGERVAVAYNGIDAAVFRPRPPEEIAAFCAEYGLDRPYFLFVGSRVQNRGYKNSRLFFDALAEMGEADFDVFCVGGEKKIEDSILHGLPKGVRCRRVDLTDDELASAYGGAIALVYPSLYEGFGMPVVEAMASGCPVITTPHGSLAEAAGDAAILIGGLSTAEMADAMTRVRDETVRARLRDLGLAHAAGFRWQPMVDCLAEQLELVVREHRTGAFDAFFAEWRRLRAVQSDVDYAG